MKAFSNPHTPSFVMGIPILLFSGLLDPLWSNDNWPEFRGPTADGHAKAHDLPLTWNEKENIRWKTAIHDKGWSSPVIWGTQIWMTTATSDGKKLYAVCVNRETGRIERDVLVFEIKNPAFCHPFNSYASPTPAVEDGRVYVHFGSAGTACLDTQTAKILWTRQDLPCDHYRAAGSSPILFDNLLILTFDGYDVQYVAALDKRTGKTVWRTDRGTNYPSADHDWRKAYSTPRVVEIAGRRQLISPSSEATIAYDPLSGRELWRVTHGGMNVAARPLFGFGKLFLATGYGGKQLLAVRPNGSGDIAATHVDWTLGKGVPTRPSLLLIDDLIYMVSDQGIASWVDAKTGERGKQLRLGGNYSASPIYADGRIYVTNQEDSTYVLQPGRDLRILHVNKLDEGCMASPAAVGRQLFLRTKTHLYCIEKMKPPG